MFTFKKVSKQPVDLKFGDKASVPSSDFYSSLGTGEVIDKDMFGWYTLKFSNGITTKVSSYDVIPQKA